MARIGALTKVTFILLVMTTFASLPAKNTAWKTLMSKSLPEMYISDKDLDAPSINYCRKKCFSIPSCTAFTVSMPSIEPINCFFSVVPLVSKRWMMSMPTPNYITIVRPGAYSCHSYRHSMTGFGTFIYCDEGMNYFEAQENCKVMGGQLYAAINGIEFNRVRNFMGSVSGLLGKEMWVGIWNRKWNSSAGQPVGYSEWSSMTKVRKPNCDYCKCAIMHRDDLYALRDRECADSYQSLCRIP